MSSVPAKTAPAATRQAAATAQVSTGRDLRLSVSSREPASSSVTSATCRGIGRVTSPGMRASQRGKSPTPTIRSGGVSSQIETTVLRAQTVTASNQAPLTREMNEEESRPAATAASANQRSEEKLGKPRPSPGTCRKTSQAIAPVAT